MQQSKGVNKKKRRVPSEEAPLELAGRKVKSWASGRITPIHHWSIIRPDGIASAIPWSDKDALDS
jgi:hypothetical protein